MIITKLISNRISFPFGDRTQNKNDIDYILSNINNNSDSILLILPSHYFQKGIREVKEIRNLILENHFLYGIFGLGKLLFPFSSIDFSIFIFNKKELNYFKIINHPKCKVCVSGTKVTDLNSLNKRKLTQSYIEHLTFVEAVLGNEGLESEKLYKVPYNDLSENKIYINYYLPENKVILDKLANEKTISLIDLAEIYKPILENKEGKVIGIRNFKYPLSIDKLLLSKKTNIKLRKGDILIGIINDIKPYLITEDYTDLTASQYTFVVRSTSNKISPEYLYLYLQSEIFEKYILKNMSGDVSKKISYDSVCNLPIIIPSKASVKLSKKVFEKLFLRIDNKVEEINDLLFSKRKINTQIQEEFINELLQKISSTKLKLIKDIIDQDFKEIKTCIENKAFKASAILCGSIFEAILLDWLSEIKKENYLIKKDEVTLYEMIKIMKDAYIFDSTLESYAHFIRIKRNLVHPKNALSPKANELNAEIVKDMIWKLQKILEKRNL